MISLEQLNQIAKKSQTSILNVARDYVQALFLSAFYQQKKSSDFFFKGGTALHFVYQSPRFSEDLDFSARAFDCRTLESLLTESLLFLIRNGLKTDLIESKKTSGGCLASFSSQIEGFLIKVVLEVSLRTPKYLKGEAALVRTEFSPGFEILILEQKSLIKEKINALLTRKKPRDFYDLYFILRGGLKAEISKKEIEAVLAEVNHLNPRLVEKELKEFLPKSHRLIIRDLPKALTKELERIS